MTLGVISQCATPGGTQKLLKVQLGEAKIPACNCRDGKAAILGSVGRARVLKPLN